MKNMTHDEFNLLGSNISDILENTIPFSLNYKLTLVSDGVISHLLAAAHMDSKASEESIHQAPIAAKNAIMDDVKCDFPCYAILVVYATTSPIVHTVSIPICGHVDFLDGYNYLAAELCRTVSRRNSLLSKNECTEYCKFEEANSELLSKHFKNLNCQFMLYILDDKSELVARIGTIDLDGIGWYTSDVSGFPQEEQDAIIACVEELETTKRTYILDVITSQGEWYRESTSDFLIHGPLIERKCYLEGKSCSITKTI